MQTVNNESVVFNTVMLHNTEMILLYRYRYYCRNDTIKCNCNKMTNDYVETQQGLLTNEKEKTNTYIYT